MKNRANTDHYANHSRQEITDAFEFGANKSKGDLTPDRQMNAPIKSIPGHSETSRRSIPSGRGNRSS